MTTITEAMPMPSNVEQIHGKVYSLTLHGVVSKKNAYTPHKGGMHKSPALKAALDDLEMQVPGELRDLQLEHPDITISFSPRSNSIDRDNLLTTVLDVLVRCQVIPDDSIKHCNGFIILKPAEISQDDSVHVLIHPKS